MNIFYKILAAVLIAVVPILAGFLCDLLHRAAVKVRSEAEDERVRTLIDEIDRAVSGAVTYVNQVFVDELKASKVFDEDEEYAKEAFEMAFEAVLKTLSDDAADYILDFFGDMREYLTVRIEAEVKREKDFF